MISVLLGIFGYFSNSLLRRGREEALRNELNNIRISIELYRVINGRLPNNLAELMDQNLTLENESGIILKKEYLQPFRIDQEGGLLDPFMGRYNYNQRTGLVKSESRGYQEW